MALTALEIFKHLPKTNCGKCGQPTCLAFAMKLAQKQASLDECPGISDEGKAALSGASAPPIKLVTIGTGDHKLEIGNETVLFRHDETFYHLTGVAISVSAGLGAEDLKSRMAALKQFRFERVGQQIDVNLLALQDEGEAAQFAAAAEIVAQEWDYPIILMSENPEAMSAALEKTAQLRPLIYAATEGNFEQMADLAKQHKCPLAVCAQGLEALASLSEKASGAGVAELVLDSGARDQAAVIADQTCLRRAALNKRFQPFGYPTITFTSAQDPAQEAIQAASYIEKYAAIVVLSGSEPWQILPILTVRQNIYTDPQKPIQLEAKLYEVGTPDEKSPVLVTTNFSLTYFTVEADVLTSKVPAWMVVVDTEGTSVLTAWAADKFTAETIAAAVNSSGVVEKVSHRKLVIPGGVAVLSGKLGEELKDEWQIQVGPRESSGLPNYLKNTWSPD